MSEGEDDYLSDKFLAAAPSTAPALKTYAQIRKEAVEQARLKNEENRLKSRRQREAEAREEGLNKSLFERAKEEEDAGIGSGSKALSMMMKMGFKPGQSLGKVEDNDNGVASSSTVLQPENSDRERSLEQSAVENCSPKQGHSNEPGPRRHKIEPLPVNEWTGKKGIGLGKRARSPSASERIAKMVKMAEDSNQHDFRDRARQEYNERRAEGRLGPAQRTCATLDEQAEISFNVLWLNPNHPDSFPSGLMDELGLHGNPTWVSSTESIQARTRRQMHADALQPLGGSHESPTTMKPSASITDRFSSDTLEESMQFLRLHAQDRLRLVLSYLRDNHAYCFWCGVQYQDVDEMSSRCPGADEEAHD